MTTNSEATQKIKFLFLLGIFFSIIALLLQVREILAPFFLALILAYVLHPVVRFMERRIRLTRQGAIAATYLLLMLAVAVALFFLLPGIIVQIGRLVTSIPHYITVTQEFFIYLEQQYAHIVPPELLHETVGRGVTRALAALEQRLTDVDAIVAVFGKIMGNILYLILTPFLAAYMLRDGDELHRGLYQILPHRYRGKIIAALDDINRVLSGFLHGYLLISIIIGTSAAIMLMLMGVRFYLILGAIAGLTNLIPYFGPFIGAVPAIIVAAFDSWALVLRVMIGYFLLQQLESLVVTPRILGGKTGLHPLVVVFAVISGGSLWGVPGMVLGIPVFAVMKILGGHVARVLF